MATNTEKSEIEVLQDSLEETAGNETPDSDRFVVIDEDGEEVTLNKEGPETQE